MTETLCSTQCPDGSEHSCSKAKGHGNSLSSSKFERKHIAIDAETGKPYMIWTQEEEG